MNEAPRVGVVGVGYVGLTTAVCVAAQGLDTVAVDIDPDRANMLALTLLRAVGTLSRQSLPDRRYPAGPPIAPRHASEDLCEVSGMDAELRDPSPPLRRDRVRTAG